MISGLGEQVYTARENLTNSFVYKITLHVKETDFPPGPILKLYSKILQEASSRVRTKYNLSYILLHQFLSGVVLFASETD